MKKKDFFVFHFFNVLVILLFSQTSSKHQFPFEKIIWTFWEDQIQNSPLFVQACQNKLKKVAEQANFEYILLNKNNARDYIEGYEEKFIKIIEKTVRPTIQTTSNFIRLLVIQQHGGVWVDLTSVFLNGLYQLQNIMDPKYKKWITNKFTNNPDVMLVYYSSYQNRAQYLINTEIQGQVQTILYNQMPGYEIYFIAAKKNSSLIRDIRLSYSQLTQLNHSQLEQKFCAQDIYINGVDGSNYLTCNMATYYLLQKKQRQLDKNTSIFSISRTNVFQNYKLWSLHSEIGFFILSRKNVAKLSDLFIYTQQEIQQKGGVFFIALKFTGDWTSYYESEIQKIKILFYEHPKFQMNTFLESKPKDSLCKEINFVIKNSIIDRIFQGTGIFQKNNIKTIDKNQYNLWKQHCNQIQKSYPLTEKFSYRFFQFFDVQLRGDGRRTKLQQVINLNKENVSFLQQMQIIIKANGLFINWTILLFMGFLVGYLYYLLIKNITSKFDQKSHLKFNSSNNIQKNKKYSFLQRNIHQIIYFFLFFIISNYVFIDIFGGRDQPFQIFIVVTLFNLVYSWIQSHLNTVKNKNSQIKQFLQQQNDYKMFYTITNFFSIYLFLTPLRYNRFKLAFLSILLGLVFPCMISMFKNMYKKFQIRNVSQQITINLNTSLFYYFLKIVNNLCSYSLLRWTQIFVLLLINIWPNIKYVMIFNQYLPTILTSYGIISINIILFLILVMMSINLKDWQNILIITILLTASIESYISISRMHYIVSEVRLIYMLNIGFFINIISQKYFNSNDIWINWTNSKQICQSLLFIITSIYYLFFGTFYVNIENINSLGIYELVFFATSNIILTHLKDDIKVNLNKNQFHLLKLSLPSYIDDMEEKSLMDQIQSQIQQQE